MGWPFSKREYNKRWYPHSHAFEEGVTTAVSYTPIGIVVDVATGNGGNNPVVGGLFPPAEEEGPPPDNRPLCSSFAVDNLSATQLLNFNVLGDGDCKPPNTLGTWVISERQSFCEDVANFALNPGGGACAERNAGQALAVTYCSQVDKIKQLWCTREDLGPDVYASLASAYCQTDTGRADQWCSCYNVKDGICDIDPNAAGCPEKALNFDPLVANTPEFFKSQWTGREGCFGAVCAESAGESKYLPVDDTNVCASPINICGGGSLTMENVTASTVNNKCTIGDNTFDPYTGELEDPDGNPVDNPNEDEDESSNFFTKYFPTTRDDLGDTNKQLGLGGSVSSSCLCCLCIIALVLLLTSGGGNTSTRFRR
jgi:hypothetical protein